MVSELFQLKYPTQIYLEKKKDTLLNGNYAKSTVIGFLENNISSDEEKGISRHLFVIFKNY